MRLPNVAVNWVLSWAVTDSETWLQRPAKNPGCLQLTVHVQPGAKTTTCAGIHGDALKIRLAAPPVDGKANQALIVWLARTLGYPQSAITLLRGQSSRHKVLAIDAGTDQIEAVVTQLRTLAHT